MKSIVNKMLVMMMVGALTSVVALAKVHKERVTFDSDIKVNGTLVKKGSYEVKFDDETGQVSFSRHGKVVAEAAARTEQRAKKAADFQVRTSGSGNDTQLVGVTFGGSDKDIMLNGGGGSTAAGSN